MSYALTQADSPGDTILVSGTIDDNVVVNNQSVAIAQDPGGSPAEVDGTAKGSVITIEGNTRTDSALSVVVLSYPLPRRTSDAQRDLFDGCLT